MALKLSEILVDEIKRRLRTCGMTYRELAGELGLSESTIKRSLSLGKIDIEKIERIASILKVHPSELFKAAPSPSSLLNLEQETVLASDLKLYSFFFLLLHGVPMEQIKKRFNFSNQQIEKYLLRLNKVRIIELRSGLKFRTLVSRDVRWSKTGPIAKKIVGPSKMILLKQGLARGQSSCYEFFVAKFSSELLVEFRRRLEEVAMEMFERSIRTTLSKDSRNVGFAYFLEPLDFSVMKALQDE